MRDEGILSAYDMKTGAPIYRDRTNTTHSASPIASDGRVYLAAEGGEVIVVKAGRAFEVLARNDMGEMLMATPAIAGRTMFIRTATQIYAVGRTSASRPAPSN